MQQFLKWAVILVSIILYSACGELTTVEVNTKPFFDLKGFLKSEIKVLENTTVKKTVYLNSKSETKELSNFDFNKALRVFMDSDINKPAWFDAYQADTVQVDSNTFKVSYTTTKEKLKIKTLQVSYNQSDNTIQTIVIDRLVKTSIYDATQQLIYMPNKGFSISNQQDVVLSSPNDYRIEVSYL